jgi:hypothetical protein
MQPTTHDDVHAVLRNHLDTSEIRTVAHTRRGLRAVAFGLGSLLVPVAAGLGVAAFAGSRRLGILAGGATALVAGLTRWQLQRWFTDEPAYEVERVIDDIEIRRYKPRVEAHTRFATLDFDEVRERGFRRLASYIFGGNAAHHELAMTCPVTIATRGAAHTMAFVMPPDYSRRDLPQPDDSRIELVDVPARRVAVMRYHGGYRSQTVERHAAELREKVAALGLTTRGEPMFAGFDPPTTLPLLRRAEIWLELA